MSYKATVIRRMTVAETTVSATFPEAVVIAFGYVRVSTHEQAVGGLGLDAQRAAIETACRQQRWELREVYADAGVGGGKTFRPGLNAAVTSCAATAGSILVVAKLDRLARSLIAYAGLLERAQEEGWGLVALDSPEADTPQGEAMQAMTAVFAQLERRLVGQRTKDALAAARSRGVRLGRPPAIAEELQCEIDRLHTEDDMSATAIARLLQTSGVDAPHGGTRWHTSTITRVLKRSGRQLQVGRPPDCATNAPKDT
jgi:DNA invertase Pin-like site-specific DNA recombinase